MNRKIITINVILILFIVIFHLTFFSCISENNNLQHNEDLPEAYWNQEEHDRAMHQVHQSRETEINITLHSGDEEPGSKRIKLYTGKSKYGSEDEYQELTIGKNGSIEHKIHYNHSYIGFELSKPLIPSHQGINTILFSWYWPGIWIDRLSITIDISHMYCMTYPESNTGIITSAITYPPDWEEKKVWINFERLCAITSTSREHPRGLKAQEAHIKRSQKGNVIIALNMPEFLKKWNKNFTRPWEPGDIFHVSMSIILTPPRDFFNITRSAKKDAPFIPREYNGKVDAGDGDPYLFIPSIEPLEEVIMETLIDIPLTKAMLEF